MFPPPSDERPQTGSGILLTTLPKSGSIFLMGALAHSAKLPTLRTTKRGAYAAAPEALQGVLTSFAPSDMIP